MAQKMKKALVGAAGLLALQNGLSGLTPALAADFSADVSDPAPGFSDTAADARAATTVTIDGAAIEKTEETAYDTIANVSGQFTYDQTILSPSDQVFSLFGTAATAACAAPSFTFETMSGDDAAEYYINVGGRLEKAMKLSLDDLKGQGITDTLKCSCAMSPSIVNAEVTGVALSSILQMADLERDAAFQVGSQITFEGYADDYDVAVSAVEFSLDGGQTWTSYETPEATAERWVYWFFTYDAATPGHYRLDVRCRTADGKVSPLASSIAFTVEAK